MDKIRPRTLSGFMELPPDKQVPVSYTHLRAHET